MSSSPAVIINNYLSEKLQERVPEAFKQPPRFIPTSPSNINAMGQDRSRDVFFVYDRMFRLRRSPFPHCKKEQLLYYAYKPNDGPEELFDVVQAIYDLMDNGDESAQDLNAWISTKVNPQGLLPFGSGRNVKLFKPVFFHETKVFQLEEARDIEAFGSTTSFSASKIIINYEYHVQNYL